VGEAQPGTTPLPLRPAATAGTFRERRASHTTLLRERGPIGGTVPDEPPPPGFERVAFAGPLGGLWGWYAAPVAGERPAPVLVYLHGGPALRAAHAAALAEFRAAGFAVFAPTLRGKNGNPGDHELLYGEVDDAAAAIAWVAAQPGIDRARIVTLGHSMGGALSALLALRDDVPLAQTVSVGGIYSVGTFQRWSTMPSQRGLVRFDPTDADELELRVLAPHARGLAHPHVAYVGDDEPWFWPNVVEVARVADPARFSARVVPGDHMAALAPALAAALADLCDRGWCRDRPPGVALAPAAFGAADRAAVVALLEAQRDAWNRGDLPGYMAGYLADETLVFTSGGQVRRGFEPTQARYLARYGGDRSGMGTLAFEDLEVRGLGPDAAVVLGRWVLTDTPEAGSGVFSVIVERTPNGWKVVHDHTSADPPAAPRRKPR
jgi:acetyl esterase/lipase/ketosteroid isomerase-like protein